MRPRLKRLWSVLLVLLAIMMVVQYSADDGLESSIAGAQGCPELDQKCQGDDHLFDADAACGPRIERLAQYDHEWTHGWGETRFSQFVWKDRDRRVMRYLGEDIKLQNGFGAWQPHWYWCDYRIPGGQVVDVGALPGRLDR